MTSSVSASRICSLLPSATEIVCALGLEDRLVGVTHECDYPAAVVDKPRVTSSVIDAGGMSGRDIDEAVRASLAEESTIYRLDRDLLEELAPDLILTQELCDVCAVSSDHVKTAVDSLSGSPRVVSLEPRTLAQVLDSILHVGRCAGALQAAIALTDSLRDRLRAVARAVAGRSPVRVLTLEWIDPPFVGGHWVPDMVALAGGEDVLGRAGAPSREVDWDEVARASPDLVVAMPCGFGLERAAEELDRAPLPAQWYRLPAVRSGAVYVVDGSSYFNRPGPRLVDGVEILASILHPDVYSGAPLGSFARWSTPQRA